MIQNSVVSYPERGPYGDSKFRGNTSGLLIRDLIEHFKPQSVLDPMAGGYTTRDVCKELAVPCDCFDLSSGFDVLGSDLPDKRYDMVFLHPPYMDIIQYSEDARDLSNIRHLDEYMSKLSNVILRLARYLTKEGRIIVLIGNKRKSGRYYPLGACLEVLFLNELKDEIIKVQHNVKSNGFRYRGSFIPIMHEKVLVFTGFKSVTWNELIERALKQLGGQSHVQEIYSKLAIEPKTADNPTWKCTVRRELQRQEHFIPMGQGVWACQ